MAVLKQRLHRKNDSGTYDIVYLENIATNVKLSESDTTTVASKLSNIDSSISSKADAPQYVEFNLNSSNWTESIDDSGNTVWKQSVTIEGSTTKTISNLIIDSVVYAACQTDGCGIMYFENNGGIINVVVTGACPTTDITVHGSVQETR